MNTTKRAVNKLVALATTFVLLMTLMGTAIFASASEVTTNNPVSNDDITIKASRNGDNVTWTATANKDLSLETLGITPITYSDDVFDYVSYDVGAFGKTESDFNETDEDHPMGLVGGTTQSAGDTLFSLTLKIKDGFQENTDYSVAFFFDQVDFAGNTTASWEGDTMDVIYRENTDIVKYAVTITDDKTVVFDEEVEAGNKLPAQTPSGKDGYEFKGWYTDNETTWDFEKDTVSGPMNIYAKYDKIKPVGNKVVDLHEIEISKSIVSAKHLDAENKNFSFTLKPIDNAPNIAADNKVNITNSGTEALGQAEFPGPGVYKYEITEDKDDTATDWTYDDTVYYLAITIQEDTDGNLSATPIAISKRADFSGDKVASANFENIYAPQTELDISKVVELPEGTLDSGKKFDFTITFEDPGVAGDLTDVTNKKDLTYGVPYEFTLGDGDKVNFTLPAGTQYTLVEDGATAYQAKAVVYSNNEQATPVTGENSEGVSVTAVALKSGNSVEVTNTYTVNPLMGVVNKYTPVILALLFALAAIVAIAWDRKRKLENEE